MPLSKGVLGDTFCMGKSDDTVCIPISLSLSTQGRPPEAFGRSKGILIRINMCLVYELSCESTSIHLVFLAGTAPVVILSLELDEVTLCGV